MRLPLLILLVPSLAAALTVSGINNGPDGTIGGCSVSNSTGCIISDRMVLQMGVDGNGFGAHLWGTATPGDTVVATLTGLGLSAPSIVAPNVDANGNYSIYFPSLPATTLPSQGETLHIQENGITSAAIDIQNVLRGIVMECIGQSNVADNFGDQGTVVANSQADPRYAAVRYYGNAGASGTANLVWTGPGNGPTTGIPLTCWMTALQLYETERVPVGIVNKAVGGTSIQCWSVAGVAGCPLQAVTTTGNCYTTHIAPIVGYSHQFVLWWQGESNNNAGTYDGMLEQLICSYRSRWAQGAADYWTTVMLPLGSENFPYPGSAGTWKFLPETVTNTNASPACDPNTGCTGWFTNTQPANPPVDTNSYWKFFDGINRDFWIATVDLPRVSTVVTTDWFMDNSDATHPPNKLEMARRVAKQFLFNAFGQGCSWQGCSSGGILPVTATLNGYTITVTTKLGTGNGLAGMVGYGLDGFMISDGESSASSHWFWVPAIVDPSNPTQILVQPASLPAVVAAPLVTRLRYGAFSAYNWEKVVNGSSRPLSPFQFDRTCGAPPCAPLLTGPTATPVPTDTPGGPPTPTNTPTPTFTFGPSPTPGGPCFSQPPVPVVGG